jgi:hypothetical protein
MSDPQSTSDGDTEEERTDDRQHDEESHRERAKEAATDDRERSGSEPGHADGLDPLRFNLLKRETGTPAGTTVERAVAQGTLYPHPSGQLTLARMEGGAGISTYPSIEALEADPLVGEHTRIEWIDIPEDAITGFTR